MMVRRFPDGSTGGNAPAGGSGQVSLKNRSDSIELHFLTEP